ncbi:MAG: gamma-glutamyl-gamma-aminobutyrate hydrolase family protein [Myxococcaceae bacterium]|nr:gamma-glutamyl-gamma-aminobutyrate hydrolase family protein [Myxococcaceae bacterium]MBH2006202.1 gamma-glutamyl-gamma-aminobutyrate hydrolase family protein [Myxococcaceae bacterium]
MTAARKPIIGITTVSTILEKPLVMLAQSYVDLIASAGGIPVLLTQDPEVMKILEGLLIIGGQDLDARLYQPKPRVVYRAGCNMPWKRPLDYAPNRRRDDFEIELYQAAKKKRIPILGICRGLQLINVAEGGTLYEELPKSKVLHESGPDGWAEGHFIRIDSQSRTFNFFKTQSYYLSSRHHQGIKDLASSLRASAWAEDGLVEIVEWAGPDQWIFGVQGHIEQTRHNFPLYQNMIDDFIRSSIETGSSLLG